MDGEFMRFEMIPSEPREPGWDRFKEALPAMLARPRPTHRELPIIHRLVTSGVELPELPDWLIRENLLEGIAANSQLSLEEAWQRILATGLDPDAVIAVVRQRLQRANIEIAPHIPRRGFLRRTCKVTQTKPQRQSHVLYHGHDKPLFDELGNEFSYHGLADGLDEVFVELCDTYDTLLPKMHGLGKLRAITLFQMYGASVVHPFWDANGRAFGAQMVLALNRVGYPVSEVPTLPEVHERLAQNIFGGIYTDFLWNFLETRGIPILSSQEFSLMRTQEPDEYEQYMLHLRVAIMHAIKKWPATVPVDEQYIQSGMMLLRYWLSKNEYLPREFYEQMKPRIEHAVANGGVLSPE